MATGSGIIRKVSGKVGDLVYRVSNGKQMVSAYNPAVKNPRTSSQMMQRTKWLNVMAMYKVMKPYLKDAFENKPSGQSDYNRFVGINLQAAPVYITRQQLDNGGAIVAPYMIAQGSLQPVAMEGCVTDIVAGFNPTATLGEISADILKKNPQFKQGDALSFFVVVQKVVDELPVAQAHALQLTLDLTSEVALSSLCTDTVGISANNGKLEVVTNADVCGVATVRSRRGKKLLVSSARLCIVGDVGTLVPQPSFVQSANSLGYVDESAYLEPDALAENYGNGAEDDTSGGNSGTTPGSGNGTDDPDNGESNPL